MNRTMLITNKETKEVLNTYWFGNPYKGIANFPTEEYHSVDCEKNLEVENPDTGEFEKSEHCSCKPIEKECISEFENGIWRKALLTIDLPPTTDKEDDDAFNDILLSIYNPLETDDIVEPVLKDIVTNISILDNVKIDEVIELHIEALKDQYGETYESKNIPSVSSLYNNANIEFVDGAYKISFIKKGVDIITINIDDTIKKIPVKIRDVKPYPNYIKDSNDIYWIALSIDEYSEYVTAKTIVHPELVSLIEERDYYWNELFVSTSAWADVAIRMISDPADVEDMDYYRSSVADMINWLDDEIATLKGNQVMKARASSRPTIMTRPESADKYKQ